MTTTPTMGGYPKQRLSYNDKVKDDFAWAKQCINFLIVTENFSNPVRYSRFEDYKRKLSNFQLYNNQINEEDMKKSLNDIVFNINQTQDSIQPYNKTYNKINVLLGEEFERKWNFKAIQLDPNGIKLKQKKKKELLRQYLLAELQKEIAQVQQNFQMQNPYQEGMNPEEYQAQMQQETERVLNPEQVDKYINTEYLTAHEIKANQLLRYLLDKEKLKLKKNQGFKNGLIAGEEFVWVGLQHGLPVCKVLNPLGVFYHKSAETQFIQDGLYAGFRTRMNIGEILDTYGPYMTESQLAELENIYSYVNGLDPNAVDDKMRYNFEHMELKYFGARGTLLRSEFEGTYGHINYNDFEVFHIEWVSQRKIGILEYTDPLTGNLEMDIVDEKYKINKETGETVEWIWIPEVWEGTRIGYNCFVNIGPKKLQFRDLSDIETADFYNVKLGYHGLVYENANAQPVSLMDRMKPYQYLFFAAMKKLEKLLKSDKGNKIPVDVTMIDKEMGMEKFLYYFENTDYYFYNPLQNAEKPGSAQRPGIQGVMAMTNAQSINQYIPFLQYLEQQINEQAGITKQREGQTANSEAVTNAQQNIVQSSYITKIYFMLHDELWKQVLQSLLQVAQQAYHDNPLLIQYTTDDLTRAILEIEPGELDNCKLGIFVTDSGVEYQAFNDLKQMSLSILQNPDAKISKLIKLYTSLSLGDLEREIKALEAEQDMLRQQEQQATIESNERIAQINAELENKKLELEKYKTDANNNTKIVIAELQALGYTDAGEIDNSDLIMKQADQALKQQELFQKQTTEQMKLSQDKELKEKEISLKEKELNAKKELEKLKIQQTKIQNSSQEKIATQKNKVDKELAEKKLAIEKIKARKKPSK